MPWYKSDIHAVFMCLYLLKIVWLSNAILPPDRDRSDKRRGAQGLGSLAGSVRSRWETCLRIAGTPGKNGCDP